jgi:hypothetical protein
LAAAAGAQRSLAAHEQLGDEAYGKAWAQGRAWSLSLSQALDRTLEDLTDLDVASRERADL